VETALQVPAKEANTGAVVFMAFNFKMLKIGSKIFIGLFIIFSPFFAFACTQTLGSVANEADATFGDRVNAFPFTAACDGALGSVTVFLYGWNTGALTADPIFEIRPDDGAGAPDNSIVLGTYQIPNASVVSGDNTGTFDAGTLVSGTTYWLVERNSDGITGQQAYTGAQSGVPYSGALRTFTDPTGTWISALYDTPDISFEIGATPSTRAQ